jgi:hypothetical protein
MAAYLLGVLPAPLDVRVAAADAGSIVIYIAT